jgi:hypothetical protein
MQPISRHQSKAKYKENPPALMHCLRCGRHKDSVLGSAVASLGQKQGGARQVAGAAGRKSGAAKAKLAQKEEPNLAVDQRCVICLTRRLSVSFQHPPTLQ